jgi:hypothetical protein
MSPNQELLGICSQPVKFDHLRCFGWLYRPIDERLAIFTVAEQLLTFDI